MDAEQIDHPSCNSASCLVDRIRSRFAGEDTPKLENAPGWIEPGGERVSSALVRKLRGVEWPKKLTAEQIRVAGLVEYELTGRSSETQIG